MGLVHSGADVCSGRAGMFLPEPRLALPASCANCIRRTDVVFWGEFFKML